MNDTVVLATIVAITQIAIAIIQTKNNTRHIARVKNDTQYVIELVAEIAHLKDEIKELKRITNANHNQLP